MVYLGIIATEASDPGRFIAAWASPEDLARAQNYADAARGQSFLLGRSCLRALLSKVAPGVDWRVAIAPEGKPYLIAPDDRPCPHISISHTHGMAACAVSFDGEVGVDVEFWRKRDFKTLADYAFNAQESESVASEGEEAFYRLWTLKEAFAKAQGKSIFSVLRKEEGLEHFLQATKEWSYFSNNPAENYSLSCVAQGAITQDFKFLQF